MLWLLCGSRHGGKSWASGGCPWTSRRPCMARLMPTPGILIGQRPYSGIPRRRHLGFIAAPSLSSTLQTPTPVPSCTTTTLVSLQPLWRSCDSSSLVSPPPDPSLPVWSRPDLQRWLQPACSPQARAGRLSMFIQTKSSSRQMRDPITFMHRPQRSIRTHTKVVQVP